MSAVISCTPASGDIVKVLSACNIAVAGATSADASTYDANNDGGASAPTEDPITYRFKATHAGSRTLVSHEFVVDRVNGAAIWDNVIFPDSGTWQIILEDQRDSSHGVPLEVVVAAS